MLRVRDLSKSFGGITALSGLDLEVSAGEIVGLIGPNGSGKTTTVNVLSGVYRASAGHVLFDGRDITRFAREAIVLAGLTRTFQNLRVFSDMTVRENVRLSQTMRTPISARFGIAGRGERVLKDEAEALLDEFGLAAKAQGKAGALSYGDKKRLEIARALATRPSILLLDEPAAGMNPVEVEALSNTIAAIRTRGIGVLLIEHHMKLVMGVCNRIAVLNFGRKIAEGTPAEITADPEVVASYLGKA